MFRKFDTPAFAKDIFLIYNMIQGSKAHFAQLAAANVGLGPAKHEQVAT